MSSVLDACSRRLLGWSLAGHMRTELVTDALEAAVGQRGGRHRIRGVVFHGDHGSQYTSDDYRTLCRRSGSPSRWAPSAIRTTVMMLVCCSGRPDPCYDRPLCPCVDVSVT